MKKVLLVPPILAIILAAAGSVGLSKGSAQAAAKPRPNVIVIETDDQTVEEMRIMRNTLNLLGAQGTTFDNSFTGFPLCCPSRATFLTGQYSHNNGVLGNALPTGGYEKLDHTNTLAVWLQSAGYTTAMVGKFLNGYGRKGKELEVPPGWTEWHAGVKLTFFDWTMNDQGVLRHFGSSPADYQSDVLTQKAVEVINRRVPESKPLFMWLNYHAPHSGGPREPDDRNGVATVNVGPRYKDYFANESLPNMPSFNEADVSDKPTAIRNRRPLTPQRIAAIREAYQQQMESLLSVDDGVAAVVNALAARGELANTLIIYTDDNGFFHGQHRVPSGKVLVYEPSIRVPLLMRGPGVPKAKHLKQIVSNIDLAPTIVDVADAKPARVMDGRSLMPLLRKPSTVWGRDLLIENGPGNTHYAAIRTPRYKYVEYASGETELYDLAQDPDELQNRANDPALAALRAELAGRLAKLRSCKGAGCRVGPSVSLGVSCTKKKVSARVAGSDARLVTSVAFSLNARAGVRDSKSPFKVKFARRAKRPTVNARVTLRDGRIVLRSGACR